MCKYQWNVGAWRSLVARLFRVQEAVSSNLAAPTKLKMLKPAWLCGFFYFCDFGQKHKNGSKYGVMQYSCNIWRNTQAKTA